MAPCHKINDGIVPRLLLEWWHCAISLLTKDEEMKEAATKLTIRLPGNLTRFLQGQAAQNGSSQNSEIIRAVRERMERVQREEMPAPAGE